MKCFIDFELPFIIAIPICILIAMLLIRKGNKAVKKKMDKLKEQRIAEKILQLQRLEREQKDEQIEHDQDEEAELNPDGSKAGDDFNQQDEGEQEDVSQYDGIDGFNANKKSGKSNILLEDPRDPDFEVEFQTNISRPVKNKSHIPEDTIKLAVDEEPELEEIKLDKELFENQTSGSNIDINKLSGKKPSSLSVSRIDHTMITQRKGANF